MVGGGCSPLGPGGPGCGLAGAAEPQHHPRCQARLHGAGHSGGDTAPQPEPSLPPWRRPPGGAWWASGACAPPAF
eukprot:5842313-Alexandrium_andersonii.AAC.1